MSTPELVAVGRRALRLRMRAPDVLTSIVLAAAEKPLRSHEIGDATGLPQTMQCDALRRLQAAGLVRSKRNLEHTGRGYSLLWISEGA